MLLTLAAQDPIAPEILGLCQFGRFANSLMHQLQQRQVDTTYTKICVCTEFCRNVTQVLNFVLKHVIQVSALLLELAAMKQADPTAKAVVFSSWSRLLRLVQEALKDNNICYTSIAGAQADSRVAALHRFMKDPECTVLTVVMSTGGGAAGLTLTVASHVFLLEPNLNPGLEAQAAARVYRLGKLCK